MVREPPHPVLPPTNDPGAADTARWMAAIVESSNDAIITKSLTGTILSWNAGAERVYGYAAAEIVGKNVSVLAPPELADELPAIYRRLVRGQQVSHFETQRIRKDGKRISVSLTISPLKDAQGNVIAASAIARDVSADRAAREALSQMHRRLVNVLESITDAFCSIGRDWRFTYVNHEAQRIFGKSPEDLLGRSIWDVFPDAIGTRFQREYERAAAENVTAAFEEYYPPLGRWFEVHAYPSPSGLAIYFRDVTQRRNIEEGFRRFSQELEQRVRQRTAEIRTLASQLTLAEQRERRRLAEVLHDELQQLLVGVRYRTESLKHCGGAAAQEAAAEIATLISQCLSVSRSLTAELSPPVLQRRNALVPALQWLGQWMGEKHGLTVEIEVHEPVQSPAQEVTLLVFRSVRELLFNTVKHARVDKARVSLMSVGDYLQAEVSDDGAGFDLSHMASASGGGFGLSSIRDRLELLGGCLEIHAHPGRGSHFVLYAPAPVVEEQLAAQRDEE
ncbi:MAG: PAS domain S-box protein [Planctomycetaceae bacterium]|nr:PAS domain S-box protein [Planctomycetaceae bacterium]